MRKTRGTRDLRLRGLFLAAWCGVGPLADDAHAQSGHSLRGNAVVVEGESHWNNWSFPAGTLKIDAGGVRPRLWRRHTNAVRDIVDNLRFNPPGVRRHSIFRVSGHPFSGTPHRLGGRYPWQRTVLSAKEPGRDQAAGERSRVRRSTRRQVS